MDLRFSQEDDRYRVRLQGWLQQNAPSPRAGAGGDPIVFLREWQRRLYEAGYIGLGWPREYGGRDASLTEQMIVSEELARTRTPPLINTIGLTILGPTLIQHGTKEQCRRLLPRILRAEDLWCQGFSEPEAGSDLAALRTRAQLDGDVLVVNGQKVWTSLAPIADWCFLLARTDPSAPKRDGISYLLCDMKSPGISVRPLRNAAGGHHFSEVFFDEVRIPLDQLVGELHGGWRIARSTLDHERSGLASVVAMEQTLERIWKTGTNLERGPRRAIDDQATRRRLAQHWIEIEGLRHLGYRALSAQLSGREPGAAASVGKLFGSELRQGLARTALAVAGPLASVAKKSPHVLDRGRWHAAYFDALAYSIGGGTSEIMRNVIAERLLGLPRSYDD